MNRTQLIDAIWRESRRLEGKRASGKSRMMSFDDELLADEMLVTPGRTVDLKTMSDRELHKLAGLMGIASGLSRDEIDPGAYYTLWQRVGSHWVIERSFAGHHILSTYMDDVEKSWSTSRPYGVFEQGVDPNMRENPRAEDRIEIEYGVVENTNPNRGGWLPMVWKNDRLMLSSWSSRAYDKDEALKMAKQAADDEAYHYTGDWDLSIRPRMEENPTPDQLKFGNYGRAIESIYYIRKQRGITDQLYATLGKATKDRVEFVNRLKDGAVAVWEGDHWEPAAIADDSERATIADFNRASLGKWDYRENPHGSFARMGGYRETDRRTGLTQKGERMVREIEADSPYGPDAPGIAYATVYARAKDRPGTGLVTKDWAREHGYPRPNPGDDMHPGQTGWAVEVSGRTEFTYPTKREADRKAAEFRQFYGPGAPIFVRRSYERNPADVDQTAVTELALYIENDADIYRQHTMPVFRNLARKWKSGNFDASKAPQAFSYVAEAGAKKYVREFGGGTWHHVFPKPVRDTVAQMMAAEFVQEAELGNLYE